MLPIRPLPRSRNLRGGGRQRRASVLALQVVLFVILCTILPLAEASPPDPLWIAGIYDGADHDEVVALVTSATGTARPVTSAGVRPTAHSFASAFETEQGPISAAERSPASVRAPPTP